MIRGKVFKDIKEHDEKIIELHNEVVKPQDHVYFLGDVAINKGGLKLVQRMQGHKRLVRGNHDIFDDRLYYEAGFEKIFGVRVFPKHNLIFSHIPLHPDSLRQRSWKNIHGHLHERVVMIKPEGCQELSQTWYPDPNYQCVSLEQTSYKPVLIME